MSEALRMELAPFNVDVVNATVGAFSSSLVENAGTSQLKMRSASHCDIYESICAMRLYASTICRDNQNKLPRRRHGTALLLELPSFHRRYDSSSSMYQRIADKVVLSATASQVRVEKHSRRSSAVTTSRHACGHA